MPNARYILPKRYKRFLRRGILLEARECFIILKPCHTTHLILPSFGAVNNRLSGYSHAVLPTTRNTTFFVWYGTPLHTEKTIPNFPRTSFNRAAHSHKPACCYPCSAAFQTAACKNFHAARSPSGLGWVYWLSSSSSRRSPAGRSLETIIIISQLLMEFSCDIVDWCRDSHGCRTAGRTQS